MYSNIIFYLSQTFCSLYWCLAALSQRRYLTGVSDDVICSKKFPISLVVVILSSLRISSNNCCIHLLIQPSNGSQLHNLVMYLPCPKNPLSRSCSLRVRLISDCTRFFTLIWSKRHKILAFVST